MLSKEYVKAVSDYLFSCEVDKAVYSSVYFGEVDSELTGNVAELVKSAVDILPSYCRYDLNFSYTYTLQLQRAVNEAVIADEIAKEQGEKPKTGKPTKTAKTPQEEAEKALKDAMGQHGMEQHPDGLKHQEEINKEAEELMIGGLNANGDETPLEVSYKIKNINTSLKRIQKTLRNVSAVSESLIKGLQQVKSEWSETGYDYGRDLALMDASEFALLESEQTKKLWLLKYAKGELLQESSQDKKGLGDLIIAVDTSGSTCGRAYHGNSVIDIEMGIALAMSKLAIKNKYKVKFCFHTVKTWGHSEGFMRSNAQLNKYFAEKLMGGRLSTGDNNFEQVLIELFEPLQGIHAGKRKPGVIFITDGYDHNFNDAKATHQLIADIKKQTGIKLYSYFISNEDPRRYSDGILKVSDHNYWIDTSKPIDGQIENFTELF